MYIKTGYSGKDLQRAIVKHGIYEERMKEAEKLEAERQKQMENQFLKYFQQREQEKQEELKEAKQEPAEK